MINPETSYKELFTYINSQTEWLLVRSNGKSFSLKLDEIELIFEREKLLFSFVCDGGFQTWRITDYKFAKSKLQLELTRNFAKERENISLVPRLSAGALAEIGELARIQKAEKLGKLIVEIHPKARLVRVALNKETGRFAQIIFETLSRQTAVIADVSDTLTPEILLTSAILWLEKLQRRKKNPIETIWISAEKKVAKSLQKLHALLTENWKSRILLKEISKTGAKPLPILDFGFWNSDFKKVKPKEIQSAENLNLSELAEKIIAFAPDEIDVLFTKQGETLRFLGLPLARVRKVFGAEKAWFGVERNKQILNEKTFDEFTELIVNLKTYRYFDAPNKHHEFYRLAPEAWLEAILRKHINLIDGNLILSPLHIQFRTEKDKIDLLAIRRDGRLVIIELKVSGDREMIFQAIDYWRKIELHRLSGNLQKAKIFGDLEIKAEPPLVYLVAPMLSYHKDFTFLATTISPEIEVYRFDLNEIWRENLRVIRRTKINLQEDNFLE